MPDDARRLILFCRIALSPLDAAIAYMRELRRSDSLSLVAPSVSPLLRRRRYVLFSHVFA
jgi:hypothetical protein